MLIAISILWELPLGVVSRLLFLATRTALRGFSKFVRLVRNHKPTQWQFLKITLLKQRFALTALLTEAPRWNPHALVGRVGPLEVAKSLGLKMPMANETARSWTVVVYSYPDYRTVRVVRSSEHQQEDEWVGISLPQGSYCIAVRYYDAGHDCKLPAVQVDGSQQVQAAEQIEGVDEFFTLLRGWQSLFFRCLQYHSYVALRYSGALTKRKLQDVYLPVGGPGIQDRYGILATSESVAIEDSGLWIDAYDLYRYGVLAVGDSLV
ncbi:MAG: DUF6208 family protein, partial [Planctomycetales bacterium]